MSDPQAEYERVIGTQYVMTYAKEIIALRARLAAAEARNANVPDGFVGLVSELNTLREQLAVTKARIKEFESPLIGTKDTCKDCGCTLLFSAREIGDGYCHSCGHARLAEAEKDLNAMVEGRELRDARINYLEKRLAEAQALLVTARDAWECGQMVTGRDGIVLADYKAACLPKAWYDKAKGGCSNAQ